LARLPRNARFNSFESKRGIRLGREVIDMRNCQAKNDGTFFKDINYGAEPVFLRSRGASAEAIAWRTV